MLLQIKTVIFHWVGKDNVNAGEELQTFSNDEEIPLGKTACQMKDSKLI